MKVDLKLVKKLADLSNLEFDEAESSEIRSDLEAMLGMVNKLSELDLKNETPLIHLNEFNSPLRKDEVREVLKPEQVVKNAPAAKGDFIVVPKVIHK